MAGWLWAADPEPEEPSGWLPRGRSTRSTTCADPEPQEPSGWWPRGRATRATTNAETELGSFASTCPPSPSTKRGGSLPRGSEDEAKLPPSWRFGGSTQAKKEDASDGPVMPAMPSQLAEALQVAGVVAPHEEDDFITKCCPELSYKQRLIGCGICFALGYSIQIISASDLCGGLWKIVSGKENPVLGHLQKSGVWYTVGNLVSLMSSFFMAGPGTQLRKMMEKNRREASAAYLAAMVLTVAVAWFLSCEKFKPKNLISKFFSILILVLLIVTQQFAGFWYLASYIPFAHQCITSALGGCWQSPSLERVRRLFPSRRDSRTPDSFISQAG